MTFIMQGKERDIKLAEQFRNQFIAEYNNEPKFNELFTGISENYPDRLIHLLKQEAKIDLFKDYNALKQIAEDTFQSERRKIFIAICDVDNARAWINDNGKYTTLIFEALYRVFRASEQLKPFIVA